MKISSSLNVALKSSELVVRQYVAQLESLNAKLQKEIARLEAQHLSDQNAVLALKKELKKGPSHSIKVSFVEPAAPMPAEQAYRKMLGAK